MNDMDFQATDAEPRPSRATAKAARRQQLIDATIDCIAKVGLCNTTMARVTETAGVSGGLVHFHFASKDRLFEAVLKHLADEQRGLWQTRDQRPAQTSSALLLAIVESRFHSRICTRKKLAVWFAFYSDATARAIYRKMVGDHDDERLDATAAIVAEMVAEAGYTHIDPMETVLSVEAMYDGLWLNMLLYPADFRRNAARDRALKVIAALFPAHFDTASATDTDPNHD